MAGATLRAVLGQPTTLLVVQYRHALPQARTHSPAREGWPHCGRPSRLPVRNHHRQRAMVVDGAVKLCPVRVELVWQPHLVMFEVLSLVVASAGSGLVEAAPV